MARTIITAIVKNGMSENYQDPEDWLLAKEIESHFRGRFYRDNLALPGPHAEIIFPNKKAVSLVSKRLSEIEIIIGNSEPWKEKKEFDIYVSGSGNINIEAQELISKETKIRAERLVELMKRRCVSFYTSVIEGLKEDWDPEHICNWIGEEKNKKEDQNSDLIIINMRSIIASDNQARIPYYSNNKNGRNGLENLSFYSTKWESHMIISVCHAVSQAAELKLKDSSSVNTWDKKELYELLRNHVANPLLKEMSINIGHQGNISMTVPSLT